MKPSISRRIHSICLTLFFVSACALALLVTSSVSAQNSQSSPDPAAQQGVESPPSVTAEMEKLTQAANVARNSGDPNTVSQANKQLIALSLRVMGNLRLLESAYLQAADLYTESLKYSDSPDTRLSLAIADMSALLPDEATGQAEKILAVDPKNRNAKIILAKIFMGKQEFAKASGILLDLTQEEQGNMELRYEYATALLDTKNPEDKAHAADVLTSIVQAVGDSGPLHVRFGQAYRNAEDMPDAIQEFQHAIQLDPSTPYAYYFLGLAYLSTNEWKPTPEASTQFEAELRYYPRDFLCNYMLGFMASSQRQYDAADKYLQVATDVNPSWPEPWLYLGLDDYAQGNMKSAEVMLRKAIQYTGKDESRSNYQIRRAYIDLGRILSSSGRQKEANVYLEKARDLQNKLMAAGQQDVTAMALASGGGTMAAMVPLDQQRDNQVLPHAAENTDMFSRLDASMATRGNLTSEQLASANEQENSLRAVLGQSLSDLATSEAIRGEYIVALSYYQEAEHWDNTIPELARNLGLCAYKANNYPVAIQWLSQTLQKNPNQNNAVRAMLGMSYYATNQYADAVHAFIPLQEAGMRDPAVGYVWADALGKMQDLKEAAVVLTQYEKNVLPNETLLEVGRLWIEIGDYGKAVAVFHHILANDPAFPKAHFDAGEAEMRWQHWNDAVSEFQAELALNPDDSDAQYDLGYVDLKQSKVDEAVKLFMQVPATNTEYADAQYQLGKIFLLQGKVQDSVAHLEIAAQQSPDKDYIHYQLQAAYRKEGHLADANRELAIYSEIKAKARSRVATAMGTQQ